MKVGPGIFFARTLDKKFSRRKIMQKEQSHLKMTLLLIKDWDGFQIAMREFMLQTCYLKNSNLEVCR
jgi:hypothetical protein